jgi:hypothetical protein
MISKFGQRHPNLEFALLVLAIALIGGFGLAALNHAAIQFATN